MRDSIRRKLDKGEREQAFMADNAADFPSGPGATSAVLHTAIIDEMNTLAAQQISGFAGKQAEVDIKGNALDAMKEIIDQMNRAANAFTDEIPGSDMKFRKPRNRSQQNIRATALAFLTDGSPIKAKFIEYGLADTFIDDLQAAIDAYDAAVNAEDTSESHQAAATGGMADAAKRLFANGKKLDSIVRIKYANNPQKLAAWTVASHLEKAPQHPTPPAPPTP